MAFLFPSWSKRSPESRNIRPANPMAAAFLYDPLCQDADYPCMGLRDGESSTGLVQVVMVDSPQQCCPPKQLAKSLITPSPGFCIISFPHLTQTGT